LKNIHPGIKKIERITVIFSAMGIPHTHSTPQEKKNP
jgi:hypothetical protein